MGKLLPIPYPGQSMDKYREQLVNFQKNYWSFLKPSKGGNKFIPSPPLTLIKKPKEMRPNIIPAIVASNKRKNEKKMSSKKLSEHVEQELFDKEKRVIPNVPPEYRVKLNEGVEPKKVIKTTPIIRKESVLGSVEDKPVKKKKPYYRKKYNKPKPAEVIPVPVKSDNSIKGFTIGLIFGIVATIIVINLIK
jgi:hypothetical protein